MSKGRHWKREKARCALCGRAVAPSERRDCIVGTTGRLVCDSCVSVSREIRSLDKAEMTTFEKVPSSLCHTPKQLMDALDRTIIGQTEAKQAIAIALWKQSMIANEIWNIPKLNLLLYGPTGCGKTAIAHAAADYAGLPFISFDASTITANGYKGRDAHDVIKQLFSQHKHNFNLPYAVVFLDEVDKMAARGTSDRQTYSRADQHALLRMLEGETIDVDGRLISTENMLFIFGGAFTGIKPRGAAKPERKLIGFLREEPQPEPETPTELTVEDFIDFGMEPELMGRIGQIVPVHALTTDDLVRILLESKTSAFAKYRRFFGTRDVNLTLRHEDAEYLARLAAARGTGARGLNALVEQHVAPLLLRLSEGTLHGTVSLLEGGIPYERVV